MYYSNNITDHSILRLITLWTRTNTCCGPRYPYDNQKIIDFLWAFRFVYFKLFQFSSALMPRHATSNVQALPFRRRNKHPHTLQRSVKHLTNCRPLERGWAIEHLNDHTTCGLWSPVKWFVPEFISLDWSLFGVWVIYSHRLCGCRSKDPVQVGTTMLDPG